MSHICPQVFGRTVKTLHSRGKVESTIRINRALAILLSTCRLSNHYDDTVWP